MTPRPLPAAERPVVAQPATPSIQRNDRPPQAPQREIRELPKEQPATARPAAEARHEATPEPKDEKKKPAKKGDKKDEKKQ
jgi:hypothetical protein